MKTKLLFLMAFAFLSFTMTAQYSVSGVVKESNGQPIPGVSVKVANSSTGTTTDFDGNYALKVTKGDKVEFSSIGYTAISLIMDGSAKVNVTMDTGVALD